MSMQQNQSLMDTETTTTPAITPTHKENRLVWWVLVVVSIFTIAISGQQLATRIAAYYKSIEHPLFAYIQAQSTDFEFAGRQLSLKEDTIDDKAVIRIHFGDEHLILDVSIPPQQPLPTLYDRHKDWMALVFFADRSGMTLEEFISKFETDEIKPRLALATRTPFGIDPVKEPIFEGIEHEKNLSTGDVHREQWRLDFYEFKRDGSIEKETKRYPESTRSLTRRQKQAISEGNPLPERRDDEIQVYTWEYGAALKVMPRSPPITMEKQALRVAGWTLPVAAGGFLLLIISFFFAIAPARTTAKI